MPDERLHAIDTASVVIREVDHPAFAPPVPRTEWLFELGPGEIGTGSAAAAVEALALDAGAGCGGGNLRLTERRDQTEWGASGGTWQLLADVAVGMLSAGAYDVLKARLSAARHGFNDAVEPLSRDELVERATKLVTARYGESAANLRAVATDIATEGPSTVTLVSSAQRYTLTYEFSAGLPSATRIRIEDAD